ncbi:recombinase family protein [Streptomyces malaysiensis]|uniref:recombinase family protein n=1 Tax=Streptomyces malaysiensis TaxID=92644 RepID=UPI001BE4491A|nr:recombinase family protein [Streptomyces malaysiensis]
MSVFGGMSKGERNRIKIRVRTAMSSQAQLQGRYLGGRPLYGYRITDAGPHPNPAKAAAGQRIHKLQPDPAAAPVVLRIFRLYVKGMSAKAIAAQLTRDGIPCPSAHDPARNPHRPKPHGNRALCAPSSSTPATPATRSGTSNARKNASSTSTTSPSATAPA